jgi:carboxylesterase type B
MHGCWVSFMKTGKPICPGAPDWPRYQRETDQLMALDLQPRVVAGYRARQLDAQEAHRSLYFGQVAESIQRLLEGRP